MIAPATPAIRVRKIVLSIPPVTETRSIKSIATDLGNDEVNLKPEYQRDLRWSPDQMSGLISTVMNGQLMPQIMLYKLQDGDNHEGEDYSYECIDGQHRLFVLCQFRKCETVALPRTKPFMISWYHEESKTHVFYKETNDTKQWAQENSPTKEIAYMTKEERDYFDKFTLQVMTIHTPVSLVERCKMFTTLQQGKQNTGSDLLKNYTHIPLLAFLFHSRFEIKYKDLMLSHLTRNPKQYWLAFFIRCYFYTIEYKNNDAKDPKEPVDILMMSDNKDIYKMIKTKNLALNSTRDTEATFAQHMSRFFEFISRIPADTKFPTIVFFAIYKRLINASAEFEEILLTWLPTWSWVTEPIRHNANLWEGAKDKPVLRRKAFNDCLAELNTFSVKCSEDLHIQRTPVPKSVRLDLFKRTYGDDTFEGTCYCCNSKYPRDGHWEAGHIISRAANGTNDIDNLRCICQDCNRSMGMRNMDEFKSCYYPSVKAAAVVEEAVAAEELDEELDEESDEELVAMEEDIA